MRLIADLHIHSKYSRACSQQLTPQNIGQWCQYKGIDIVGTGDFTHPRWLAELKTALEEAENGLYQLKGADHHTRFILTTEISCIYSQGGKTRRLHLCVLAPNFETVDKISTDFTKRGFNLKADGRPIIGLSAKNLAKIILQIEPKCLIIPAHIWTPWFAVFGSKSGFDSLEECFEEMTPYIYAVETGLSSDPQMNWQLSALDNITLVSNSDAHSPANLGREANVFDIEPEKLSYDEIYNIIKNKNKKKFLSTIEFFPEEGKYHFDGHANCKYSSHPNESRKNKNICPICKKELTLGVMHRVNDLADRQEKTADQNKHIPYKNLIPLQEIISDTFGVGKNSKKVQTEYFKLVKNDPEFEILLDLDIERLKKITDHEIANKIIRMRQGKIKIEPGYDGIYGKISINNDHQKSNQNSLF
ncbi:MAG TPA: endonuclease Q family protein [bacterium]|nr:endonuclease Q family protein [bacterium]HOH67411.1 endonuclease Q family protein [bacterium]HPN81286.1 endonuclease Q family protein [bacterium]